MALKEIRQTNNGLGELLREFLCDTVADLENLPVNVAVGSTATCLEDKKVYILSVGEDWIQFNDLVNEPQQTTKEILLTNDNFVYDEINEVYTCTIQESDLNFDNLVLINNNVFESGGKKVIYSIPLLTKPIKIFIFHIDQSGDYYFEVGGTKPMPFPVSIFAGETDLDGASFMYADPSWYFRFSANYVFCVVVEYNGSSIIVNKSNKFNNEV